jgi:hypothetical protein
LFEYRRPKTAGSIDHRYVAAPTMQPMAAQSSPGTSKGTATWTILNVHNESGKADTSIMIQVTISRPRPGTSALFISVLLFEALPPYVSQLREKDISTSYGLILHFQRMKLYFYLTII